MHRIDPLRQDLLIDPFDFLGPKRKDRLKTGWPARFRCTILEEIPVAEIKLGFHERMGRPTKELRKAGTSCRRRGRKKPGFQPFSM